MQCTEERSEDYACRFFAAEGCKLLVGAYTSLNTLCTYLESEVSAEGQAEKNFWVNASRTAPAVTLAFLVSTDSGLGSVTAQLAGRHSPSVSVPCPVLMSQVVLQALIPMLQRVIFCLCDR